MTVATTNQNPASADPFIAHHAGIVEVHHALLGSFQAVVSAAEDSPRDVVVTQSLAAGRFLLGHHSAESDVLFPGIRRLGRLRSADAAFLDTWDRQHRDLHSLCERLLEHAGGPHPDPKQLKELARETLALLTPHVIDEEAGLAPDRMRAMIDLAGLEEIGRELEAMRKRFEAARGAALT